MKKLGIIATQITAFSILTTPAVWAQANVKISPPPEFVKSGICINTIISFALGVLLAIGVLAAVAFLIWGAIKWITSGGDKTKVTSARETLVASIIGLVVLLLTFVILNFVVQLLGVGGNIFDINIPTLDGRPISC